MFIIIFHVLSCSPVRVFSPIDLKLFSIFRFRCVFRVLIDFSHAKSFFLVFEISLTTMMMTRGEEFFSVLSIQHSTTTVTSPRNADYERKSSNITVHGDVTEQRSKIAMHQQAQKSANREREATQELGNCARTWEPTTIWDARFCGVFLLLLFFLPNISQVSRFVFC